MTLLDALYPFKDEGGVVRIKLDTDEATMYVYFESVKQFAQFAKEILEWCKKNGS